MALHFELFADAGAFLEAVGPTLYAFEPHNNLALGLAESMVKNGTPDDALLIAGTEQGEVRVAAVRSRPLNHINLIIGRTGRMTEDDVVALARWVRREAPGLAGVMGEPGAAATFAREWTGSLELGADRQVRILALDRVEYDGHDKGTVRTATESEAESVFDWLRGFRADIGMPVTDETELRESYGPRIAAGEVYFLELDEPVCMAARVRSTKNCDIIGGVYTPAAFRCQGHATALVARMSRLFLGRGKTRCALFTDKHNPTSNAIYERIGYREVMQAVEYTLPVE
ncbi:MAG: GNAT family N-acetyltransferase [Candidatus Hydrogenedentes bacterium]|nr:GNAT family N-acetyltransferase [Candidatus Hydrogenedentota bacterium]